MTNPLIIDELLTIRDYMRWAQSRFKAGEIFYGHGTDNAHDEAVQLILPLLDLPLDFDPRLLDARLIRDERIRLVEAINSRVDERLPVPYITGEAWFAGMPFYVDERVLIPRSPIAELIAADFQPWLGDIEPLRILDLCTGSGCIGIACALQFPDASVDLVDISEDALDVAESNVVRYALEERVDCIESDLFTELTDLRYDLIVSNPPYVDARDIAEMPPEYRHEPQLGLVAGEDGLDIVRRILLEAPDYLNEGGLLIVEVGNSWLALEEAFPAVAFTWIEFEHGEDGVFCFTREELLAYAALFAA
jgi:ribosomal protein L3 glutamine methyltransferase